MCGIIGYIGNKNAQKILIEGLKKLEYRGYDSAGISINSETKLDIRKVRGRIKNLEEALKDNEVQGYCGIAHTRWATHGKPSELNAHPHFNKSKTISLVHNGIIENYMELKKFLEKENYEFLSETDTEVLVHLIDYYYKGDIYNAVMDAVDKIKGAYALGVMSKNEPEKIIAVRKDSPLIIGKGNDENFIASDVAAILDYTKEVYYLDEDEVAIIKKDSIDIYNKTGEEIKKDLVEVKWDNISAKKGGYDHFMLKEIFEQPKVVRDTLYSRIGEDILDINLSDVNITKEVIDKIDKVYIVACGTASYAGEIGAYLIEKLARISVKADVASEFRYKDPIIDKNTLVIVVSQSGETADTLAALRLAKSKGAITLGIVNVVGSTIARECDNVLYTIAGPEIAVASTKAYSAQLVAMYLISCKIAILKGYIHNSEFTHFRDELLSIPDKIKTVLKECNNIKELANKYKNSKNVFYIGRGLDFYLSKEGSLKLKEIAYIHSEPYAAGELKHGPIALIEDDTLVVGLLTDEDLMSKTISNLKEVKARGAKVLIITMEGNSVVLDVADDVIYIPRVEWVFTSIIANIPQQLFAYYMANILGNDVDKPRNLAKSVTVE